MGNKRLAASICTLCFIILTAAVTSVETAAQKIYKSYDDKSYVYDNTKKVIYNKSRENCRDLIYSSDGFSVNNAPLLSQIVSETLSAERLQQLKNEMMAIIFYCDTTGNVQSMQFVFTVQPFLTVKEVADLESAFMKKQFSISYSESPKTPVRFTIPCFFSRLLAE